MTSLGYTHFSLKSVELNLLYNHWLQPEITRMLPQSNSLEDLYKMLPFADNLNQNLVSSILALNPYSIKIRVYV